MTSAALVPGIKVDTRHRAAARQGQGSTVTSVRVIVLLTVATERADAPAVGLSSPKFQRSFGPDGGLQNEVNKHIFIINVKPWRTL